MYKRQLQAQAEEMESQAEQLRIRSEQMVAANADLARREEILQVLLRCARTLPSPQQAIEEICRVAGKMLGGPDGAAGVTMRSGDKIFVHTWSGSHPIAQRSWDYDRSFASIVLERGRTAALFDLALRPDIELPTPDGAAPIRAILATPYRIQGRAAGVFEVYRRTPHQFTEEDFRAIEWLSAQCALILEMLQLHEEIAERRKAAEEGSRRKTHFLAAVSHDIRTPANAITLISELIRRLSESNPASPEIQQLAADLQNASRSMVELVSDVLDLTRFDSGSQELNVSDFSLRAVLDAEIRQFLPTARQKGLALSLAFEAETEGLRLRTDRLKLARVVTNLIGNALKFTDAGSVQVTVARDRDGDGGVRIDVADTGIGIPAREIDAIFDEFLQLRNPERDRSKGTGLGLAICKRLVEAIGARMSVESEPGKGSCFRLHLPEATVAGSQERLPEQEQDAETDSLGTASSSDDRCLAGARILLVEDHDTTRRSTALLLEQYGAKVLAAAGGNEAIQALMHRDPDVLLLDLMLPDMDGAEVLRRLPAIRALRLACVLVVTGDARPEREAEVHALGADGLVHKPIDVRSLVGKIHSLLEKAHRAGSRPGGRALAP
ncbi:MAG: ATP-binding protein [Candidatus Eisenbacteria bacterium]|nr:ATP-binding protein [Candidatus Eisenbacteria bacterium]